MFIFISLILFSCSNLQKKNVNRNNKGSLEEHLNELTDGDPEATKSKIIQACDDSSEALAAIEELKKRVEKLEEKRGE